MPIAGECFCGEVRYEVKGKLRDARSCHCSRCRKAFSSQASAYALVNSEEFKWIAGKELLTSYIGLHGFGLQFCSKCGSTLCGIFEGSIHGVTLGGVNGDPNIEIVENHGVSQLEIPKSWYKIMVQNHGTKSWYKITKSWGQPT